MHHLYNVKRLAYELNEPPAAAMQAAAPGASTDQGQQIEELVRRIVQEIIA